MPLPATVYLPRHPQDSDDYHCIEDYFETFLQGYIEQVIYRLPPDRSYVSSTTFCGNISLTYKSGFPILTSNESKFLSKKVNLRSYLLSLT